MCDLHLWPTLRLQLLFGLVHVVRWTMYVYKRPELLQRQSARLQLRVGESNLNVSAMAQMSSAFCTLSPA